MALLLYTRKRQFVNNEMSPERSGEELEDLRRMFCVSHPFARLRSNTSTYNCMGLVFASRRTHIDVDLIEQFLRDDEWRKLDNPTDVQPGDIVLYRLNGLRAHVGIVWECVDGRTTMLSKWGDAGEYFHGLCDVPGFCGSPSEYYTDRR